MIRSAEGLNLLGVTRAIADLAERSRTKKLLPDDVQGGTFTITNPGGYGTFHGTPVINQPQAAILGTYAVVKRPWVIQDARGADVIAVRPIMNLTLTYDHRLVDGALAGRFLRDLREKLETWPEERTRPMRGPWPLCGGVTFELTEPFVRVSLLPLHDVQGDLWRCRTATGRVPTSAVNVLTGRELGHDVPARRRAGQELCGVCGSNLFGSGWPDSEMTGVRLTALDDQGDLTPEMHIWVRSVAPWETLPEDGLPRYEQGAP